MWIYLDLVTKDLRRRPVYESIIVIDTIYQQCASSSHVIDCVVSDALRARGFDLQGVCVYIRAITEIPRTTTSKP